MLLCLWSRLVYAQKTLLGLGKNDQARPAVTQTLVPPPPHIEVTSNTFHVNVI